MTVFWAMVAGAGISLVSVLFGVVIADVFSNSNEKPKEEM